LSKDVPQPVRTGAATAAGGSQAASVPWYGCQGFKSYTNKDIYYLRWQPPA